MFKAAKLPSPTPRPAPSPKPVQECWAKVYKNGDCDGGSEVRPQVFKASTSFSNTHTEVKKIELAPGCSAMITDYSYGRGVQYTFHKEIGGGRRIECMQGAGRPGFNRARSIRVFRTVPSAPTVTAHYVGYHGGCRPAPELSPPLL